jgi:hypothetical protein
MGYDDDRSIGKVERLFRKADCAGGTATIYYPAGRKGLGETASVPLASNVATLTALQTANIWSVSV